MEGSSFVKVKVEDCFAVEEPPAYEAPAFYGAISTSMEPPVHYDGEDNGDNTVRCRNAPVRYSSAFGSEYRSALKRRRADGRSGSYGAYAKRQALAYKRRSTGHMAAAARAGHKLTRSRSTQTQSDAFLIDRHSLARLMLSVRRRAVDSCAGCHRMRRKYARRRRTVVALAARSRRYVRRIASLTAALAEEKRRADAKSEEQKVADVLLSRVQSAYVVLRAAAVEANISIRSNYVERWPPMESMRQAAVQWVATTGDNRKRILAAERRAAAAAAAATAAAATAASSQPKGTADAAVSRSRAKQPAAAAAVRPAAGRDESPAGGESEAADDVGVGAAHAHAADAGARPARSDGLVVRREDEYERVNGYIQCNACVKPKQFKKASAYEYHVKYRCPKNREDRKCDKCYREFRSRPSYESHYASCVATPEDRVCQHCGIKVRDFNKHVREKCPVKFNFKSAPGFPCDRCGRVLLSARSLKVHKEGAGKSKAPACSHPLRGNAGVRCPLCPKVPGQKTYGADMLIAHLNSEHGYNATVKHESFDTKLQFDNWMLAMEKETCQRFMFVTATSRRPQHLVAVHKRSAWCVYSHTRNVHKPTPGVVCPAFVNVTEKVSDGSVQVTYCLDHCGHGKRDMSDSKLHRPIPAHVFDFMADYLESNASATDEQIIAAVRGASGTLGNVVHEPSDVQYIGNIKHKLRKPNSSAHKERSRRLAFQKDRDRAAAALAAEHKAGTAAGGGRGPSPPRQYVRRGRAPRTVRFDDDEWRPNIAQMFTGSF